MRVFVTGLFVVHTLQWTAGVVCREQWRRPITNTVKLRKWTSTISGQTCVSFVALPIKLHWPISVHYGFMLCQLEQRDPDMFLSCSGLRWQIWAFWSCCWLAKGWLHYWMYQHLVQDDFTNFNNLGIAVEGALCLPVAVLFGFFVTDFREHSECRKCIGCQCLLECVALTSTHWLVVELLGPVFGGLTGPRVFWYIDWLWLWCHHSDTWDKIFIVLCSYWVILSW